MLRRIWILTVAAAGSGCSAPPGGVAVDAAQAVDVAAVDSAPPVDVSLVPAWCAPDQPLRRRLTVLNNAATTLPAGFQVEWLIDIEDLVTAPAGQWTLHVFHAGAASCTELNRWVDDTTALYEAMWVALVDPIPPSGTDSNYWLYYGNEAAELPLYDSTEVFDFWDDFNTFLIPDPNWLTHGGPTKEGSNLELGPGDGVMTTQAWPAGYAVDYSLKLDAYTPSFWAGFEGNADDFAHEPPWLIWTAEPNLTGPVVWPSLLLSAADTVWWGSMVAVDPDPHIYNIDRLADRVVFRYENYPASAEEHELAAPFTDPLRFRFSNEGSSWLFVQMVRVRQTAYPFPTSSVGAEEEEVE
jgi:hypothetical protein